MSVSISVDLSIYPLDVVMRACLPFTGRFYVSPQAPVDGRVVVELTPRDRAELAPDLAGQFANALLDHYLRGVIAAETRGIRELLLAQAFCESDLLDRRNIEADAEADPRGIAR
jgi:His-Xaa-Ser system protein HxsD